MDLNLSTERTKPGEKISIHCSAANNSFVSLLGVDQSVTLLGSGNDIDKPRILADMNDYNAHENYPDLKIKGSAENRYSDFGELNAFILTNAQNGTKICEISERIDEGKDIERDDSDDSGLNYDNDEKFVGDANKIRKNFPETWIFNDFELNNDGKYEFKTEVPDTITSFMITGFAVHPEKGLAIATKKKVTVFQDFFLKLYLPYSVRLGEILKVDVSVFNYINRPKKGVDAKVEMFNNDGEFDFVDAKKVGNDCVKSVSKDTKKSKKIFVPEDSGAATFFLIKPLITGQIKISVNVSSLSRKDAVQRMMIVEHEGLVKRGNQAALYKLNKSFDSSHFNIPIDLVAEKVIGESILIEASVVGDLIGPAHHNIRNLV